MIVRRQRIAFVVIQAVAIGGHARHEDVAHQAVARGLHRGFHLRRRGAALPVVDVVEDDLEAAACERLPHLVRIVAVRHQILHAPAQVVLGLAVQDGDIMAGLHQFLNQHRGR